MQHKVDSMMEAIVNVIVGFTINLVANIFLLPAVLGVEVNLVQFTILGVFFTIISIARSYILRRAFNGLSIWEAIQGRYYGRKAS